MKKEFLLELHRLLRLTRLIDDRLAVLYRQGLVPGGVFSSRGQEAVAVASAMALGSDDFVCPLLRDLGAILVRGATPREVFCQQLARRDSPTGGRELQIHFGDLRRGFIPPIGMLGAMIPVMVGVGLARRMQGIASVALTCIGDGGSSTGDFHEGLNFAAVMKAPLVLVLENNRYAYSTPTGKQSAITEFVTRAAGYGIAGESVDGNDALAVYETTRRAVERARAGEGPTLIEAHTMRMAGHAAHDDSRYVPRELLEEWRRKDPIERFERFLLEGGHATREELDAILAALEKQVDEDVEFALASPPPPAEWAERGVYSGET